MTASKPTMGIDLRYSQAVDMIERKEICMIQFLMFKMRREFLGKPSERTEIEPVMNLVHVCDRN